MTKYCFLILSSILLFACNGSQENKLVNRNNSSESKNKTETFDLFYTKFFQDSIFQMSRIKFPLTGKYYDHEEVKEWTANEWHLFKTPLTGINTKEFKTNRKITKKAVEEKIWIENSGFLIEIKYESIRGKWFLTHYNEINN